jgi:hypothetical protein
VELAGAMLAVAVVATGLAGDLGPAGAVGGSPIAVAAALVVVHKFFSMRWNLPPAPPMFLRKIKPPRLERIESMYIMGKAKFEPVEFRVRQARIGETSFL